MSRCSESDEFLAAVDQLLDVLEDTTAGLRARIGELRESLNEQSQARPRNQRRSSQSRSGQLQLPDEIEREEARDALGEPWNLTSRDVADYLALSLDTIYRIPPEAMPYITPRGHRRYRASDVQQFTEAFRAEQG